MVNGEVELMVELNDIGGVFQPYNYIDYMIIIIIMILLIFCVLWDCLGDLVFGENPHFPSSATSPKEEWCLLMSGKRGSCCCPWPSGVF